MMKFLVVVGVILAVQIQAIFGCSIEEVDKCASNINVLDNPDIKIPKDDSELDEFCKTVSTNFQCLKDYADNCQQGTVSQLMSKMIGRAQIDSDHRCKEPKERAEFLKNVQCFQDDAKILEFRKCSDRHIIMTEETKSIPKAERGTAICCGFHYSFDCMKKTILSQCGQEVFDYIQGLINDNDDDTIGMACGEFISLEVCDAKYTPDVWNKLKSAASIDDPAALAKRHKYHSILAPLLELMEAP